MNLISKLKQARTGAAKAGGDAREAIDELRSLRTRLLDERDDAASRPRPLDEARDAIAAEIIARAERALDDVSLRGLMRPGDNRGPRLNISTEDAGKLALAANAEGVVALLSARLSQVYEGQPEPMTAADQRAELERIDGELLSAELAEEAVVRELEAAGFEIARRPDADPRALLAADAELR